MRGFPTDAVAFLRELRANNERAWFDANKGRYELSIRLPALELIQEIGDWFAAEGIPYVAQAKKIGGSLLRIHRDTRFTVDPRPYHEHVTLRFLHKAASPRRSRPVLGLRFDGEAAAVGGGLWNARPDLLKGVRDQIVADPAGWRDVCAGVDLDGEHRKATPRGYPKDHPMAQDLRRKRFVGHVPLPIDAIDGDLMTAFQEASQPVLRFNRFLDEALPVPLMA